jgi:hypothetical protein
MRRLILAIIEIWMCIFILFEKPLYPEMSILTSKSFLKKNHWQHENQVHTLLDLSGCDLKKHCYISSINNILKI